MKNLALVLCLICVACTPKDQFNAMGRPLVITKGGTTYRFQYYDNGLIKTATDPNGTAIIEYNALKKISKITQGDKISQFTYNDQKLLTKAWTNQGKSVTLTYEGTGGLISTITDQDGTKLNLKYDDKFKKPSSVSVEGVGSINITYTETGNVDKVYSPQGKGIAIVIALNLQNLLELCEPKGLDYIFNSKGARK